MKIKPFLTTTPSSHYSELKPTVVTTLDDGSTNQLFDYYHDEILFTADELARITFNCILNLMLPAYKTALSR